MRAKNSSPEQRSLTEQARRAQIVEAAVEVIADEGYAKASFARIATKAGLSSTGLITYHFANRQDLIDSIVDEVMTAFAGHVRERVDAEFAPAARLDAFVSANLDFIRTHRKHLVAVLDITAGSRTTLAKIMKADIDALEDLLVQGQRQGEFRAFHPRSVAIAIRSMRDGILRVLSVEPDFDLTSYEHELRTLVRLATSGEIP
ncbi:TetR/AcrR family transcriptional regulator [Nonomuraea purpurea]|uniref:TetR/AcrR family transcriptional regulator n=1 Tax=Nonomuraea purpurea TaxID=1849276 RepID=A0ABV8GJM9_9ACTN